jgi:TonB family protein
LSRAANREFSICDESQTDHICCNHTGAGRFAASSIRAERRFKPAPPPARIVSYFVNAFPPNYPDIALTQHKRGNGLFRLTIDRPTGKVTAVKVLRSTGVKVLDDSAAAAFLQWKAKPNRVHYVVIPVNFIAWD